VATRESGISVSSLATDYNLWIREGHRTGGVFIVPTVLCKEAEAAVGWRDLADELAPTYPQRVAAASLQEVSQPSIAGVRERAPPGRGGSMEVRQGGVLVDPSGDHDVFGSHRVGKER